MAQDLAFAQGGTLWAARPAAKPAPLFNIPKSLGTPHGSNVAPSGETVIHIEDAHDSFEAQEKIHGLLTVLANNYDVRSVALEGSSGEINPALFKTYPDQSFAIETAKNLVKEGRLNAGELFAITQDDVSVYGVEEKTLYRENLDAFRRLLANKEKIEAELRGLSRTLEVLSERLDNPLLKALKRKGLTHDDRNSSDFTKKWDFWRRHGEEKGISIEAYPDLKILNRVTVLEKEIDFDEANSEREKLLQFFKTRLRARDKKELVLKSLAFKAEKLSDTDFHLYLAETAKAYGIEPASHFHLWRYTQYLSFFDSLGLANVFGEIEDFEEKIKTASFASEDERTLYFLEKDSVILKDVLSGEASAETFERLRDLKKENFIRVLSSLTEKNHVPLYGGLRVEHLFDALPDAVHFYELAKRRDRILLENTLRKMREKHERVAALVTGGFHTRGISQMLEDKNLSYLVVLPKITDPHKKRPYITLITRKTAEYEKALGSDSSRFTLALGLLAPAAKTDKEAVRAVIAELVGPLKGRPGAAARLAEWMEDYRAAFKENPASSFDPDEVEKMAEEILGARLADRRPDKLYHESVRALSDFHADETRHWEAVWMLQGRSVMDYFVGNARDSGDFHVVSALVEFIRQRPYRADFQAELLTALASYAFLSLRYGFAVNPSAAGVVNEAMRLLGHLVKTGRIVGKRGGEFTVSLRARIVAGMESLYLSRGLFGAAFEDHSLAQRVAELSVDLGRWATHPGKAFDAKRGALAGDALHFLSRAVDWLGAFEDDGEVVLRYRAKRALEFVATDLISYWRHLISSSGKRPYPTRDLIALLERLEDANTLHKIARLVRLNAFFFELVVQTFHTARDLELRTACLRLLGHYHFFIRQIAKLSSQTRASVKSSARFIHNAMERHYAKPVRIEAAIARLSSADPDLSSNEEIEIQTMLFKTVLSRADLGQGDYDPLRAGILVARFLGQERSIYKKGMPDDFAEGSIQFLSSVFARVQHQPKKRREFLKELALTAYPWLVREALHRSIPDVGDEDARLEIAAFLGRRMNGDGRGESRRGTRLAAKHRSVPKSWRFVGKSAGLSDMMDRLGEEARSHLIRAGYVDPKTGWPRFPSRKEQADIFRRWQEAKGEEKANLRRLLIYSTIFSAIEKSVKQVYRRAKNQFGMENLDFMELVAEAVIAIGRAFDKFEPSRSAFATYGTGATSRYLQSYVRHERNREGTVKSSGFFARRSSVAREALRGTIHTRKLEIIKSCLKPEEEELLFLNEGVAEWAHAHHIELQEAEKFRGRLITRVGKLLLLNERFLARWAPAILKWDELPDREWFIKVQVVDAWRRAGLPTRSWPKTKRIFLRLRYPLSPGKAPLSMEELVSRFQVTVPSIQSMNRKLIEEMRLALRERQMIRLERQEFQESAAESFPEFEPTKVVSISLADADLSAWIDAYGNFTLYDERTQDRRMVPHHEIGDGRIVEIGSDAEVHFEKLENGDIRVILRDRKFRGREERLFVAKRLENKWRSHHLSEARRYFGAAVRADHELEKDIQGRFIDPVGSYEELQNIEKLLDLAEQHARHTHSAIQKFLLSNWAHNLFEQAQALARTPHGRLHDVKELYKRALRKMNRALRISSNRPQEGFESQKSRIIGFWGNYYLTCAEEFLRGGGDSGLIEKLLSLSIRKTREAMKSLENTPIKPTRLEEQLDRARNFSRKARNFFRGTAPSFEGARLALEAPEKLAENEQAARHQEKSQFFKLLEFLNREGVWWFLEETRVVLPDGTEEIQFAGYHDKTAFDFNGDLPNPIAVESWPDDVFLVKRRILKSIIKHRIRIGKLADLKSKDQDELFRLAAFLGISDPRKRTPEEHLVWLKTREQKILRKEGRFHRPGIAYDEKTGLTFDHWRLAAQTLGDLSAASKESLHLTILGLALLGDEGAQAYILGLPLPVDENGQNGQIFVLPEDAARAESLAFELLAKKITSYKKFRDDERFKGFGGFLPWFRITERGMEPLPGWKDKVPSLDNGEFVWALYFVYHTLEQKYPELSKDYREYFETLKKNAVKIFYEGDGKVRAEARIENPVLEPSANRYSTANGFYLDDPYEGEMMAHFLTLFADWGGSGRDGNEEIEKIWRYKRTKLEPVHYSSSKGILITGLKGERFAPHEMRGWLFLPYLDIDVTRMIFENGEKIRTHEAAKNKEPGLRAAAYDPDLNYRAAMGVETMARKRPVDAGNVFAPSAAYPQFLIDLRKGLEWWYAMDAPQMRSEYGMKESALLDGTPAEIVTSDAKYLVALSLMGGVYRQIGEYLENDGKRQMFDDRVESEYLGKFPTIHGQEAAIASPTASIPPDWNGAPVTAAARLAERRLAIFSRLLHRLVYQIKWARFQYELEMAKKLGVDGKTAERRFENFIQNASLFDWKAAWKKAWQGDTLVFLYLQNLYESHFEEEELPRALKNFYRNEAKLNPPIIELKTLAANSTHQMSYLLVFPGNPEKPGLENHKPPVCILAAGLLHNKWQPKLHGIGAEFLRQGYAVCYVDAPGHGTNPLALRAENMAHFLELVIEDLKLDGRLDHEHIRFVAHSMGSLIYFLAPEKVKLKIFGELINPPLVYSLYSFRALPSILMILEELERAGQVKNFWELMKKIKGIAKAIKGKLRSKGFLSNGNTVVVVSGGDERIDIRDRREQLGFKNIIILDGMHYPAPESLPVLADPMRHLQNGDQASLRAALERRQRRFVRPSLAYSRAAYFASLVYFGTAAGVVFSAHALKRIIRATAVASTNTARAVRAASTKTARGIKSAVVWVAPFFEERDPMWYPAGKQPNRLKKRLAPKSPRTSAAYPPPQKTPQLSARAKGGVGFLVLAAVGVVNLSFLPLLWTASPHTTWTLGLVSYAIYAGVIDFLGQMIASKERVSWKQILGMTALGVPLGLFTGGGFYFINLVFPLGLAFAYADGVMMMLRVASQWALTFLRVTIETQTVHYLRLKEERRNGEAVSAAERHAKKSEAYWMSRFLSIARMAAVQYAPPHLALWVESFLHLPFRLWDRWAIVKQGFIVQSERLRESKAFLIISPLVAIFWISVKISKNGPFKLNGKKSTEPIVPSDQGASRNSTASQPLRSSPKMSEGARLALRLGRSAPSLRTAAALSPSTSSGFDPEHSRRIEGARLAEITGESASGGLRGDERRRISLRIEALANALSAAAENRKVYLADSVVNTLRQFADSFLGLNFVDVLLIRAINDINDIRFENRYSALEELNIEDDDRMAIEKAASYAIQSLMEAAGPLANSSSLAVPLILERIIHQKAISIHTNLDGVRSWVAHSLRSLVLTPEETDVLRRRLDDYLRFLEDAQHDIKRRMKPAVDHVLTDFKEWFESLSPDKQDEVLRTTSIKRTMDQLVGLRRYIGEWEEGFEEDGPADLALGRAAFEDLKEAIQLMEKADIYLTVDQIRYLTFLLRDLQQRLDFGSGLRSFVMEVMTGRSKDAPYRIGFQGFIQSLEASLGSQISRQPQTVQKLLIGEDSYFRQAQGKFVRVIVGTRLARSTKRVAWIAGFLTTTIAIVYGGPYVVKAALQKLILSSLTAVQLPDDEEATPFDRQLAAQRNAARYLVKHMKQFDELKQKGFVQEGEKYLVRKENVQLSIGKTGELTFGWVEGIVVLFPMGDKIYAYRFAEEDNAIMLTTVPNEFSIDWKKYIPNSNNTRALEGRDLDSARKLLDEVGGIMKNQPVPPAAKEQVIADAQKLKELSVESVAAKPEGARLALRLGRFAPSLGASSEGPVTSPEQVPSNDGTRRGARLSAPVILIGFTAESREDVYKALRHRIGKGIELIEIEGRLSPPARLAALHDQAKALGAAETFFIESGFDGNAQAKLRFLKQLDLTDLRVNHLLEILNNGARFSQLSEKEQGKIYDLVISFLPPVRRMAPAEMSGPRLSSAEMIKEFKLNLFHPSFGDTLENVSLPAPGSKALWTLKVVTKDPLFLRTLKDRDEKLRLNGQPPIEDYLVLRRGEEAGLGRELADWFGGRFLYIEEGESLYGIYRKLKGAPDPRHVIFIDSDENSTLSRDPSRLDLNLLYIRGRYVLNLDKVVVRLLVRGGNIQDIGIKGLINKNGRLIFAPVAPIDYEARLAEFYRTEQAVTQST